ncbi:high mobility group B protein 14 [Amborella trichopoda]|uniref:HMG box domain-containing protein n=1 Tax=Amborella trichopoda TaxID=13333 RepID=W1PGF4_AMBTC|nr:high mobility group B protein 14 [Amborella trichopoda]ERN09092.1 hypothetical protein AMTR_s00014p00061870 [Amborella trichopoda]|eukprot:XP_006847511.1 high mobility group B protein 14 [Amborella trichopoda]
MGKKRKLPSKSASAEDTEEPTENKRAIVRAEVSKSSNNKTKKKQKKPKGKTGNKEDPDKPKKPPTAFFYFLLDFKKGYQEQNPHVKSMRDIGKACGVKWKAMSYEEKVEYYDIATEKRAEFEKAMAAYVERRESGEYDED